MPTDAEWLPIEVYDALERKPDLAVFYFIATNPARVGGYAMGPTVQLARHYGSRVCSLWMPLPALPANALQSGAKGEE